MKGLDEVGKGQRNDVQKGRRAGKMEGDRDWNIPVPYGRKGAQRTGRRVGGGKSCTLYCVLHTPYLIACKSDCALHTPYLVACT